MDGTALMGSSAATAVMRRRQGHGRIAIATAGIITRYDQSGGSSVTRACRQEAAASSQGHAVSMLHSAHRSPKAASEGHMGIAAVLARINGTSQALKTGIAAKFTTKLASEKVPKSASVMGTSARLTISWVRANSRHQEAPASGPVATMSTSTAPKLSQ